MFGLRAVHMTASAWAYKPLHDPVVAMLKAHQIDTIEMDIKDEDGHVQYKSNVPLAQQDGAENTTLYDPAEMLNEIHSLGGQGSRAHRGLQGPAARRSTPWPTTR